MSVGYRAAPAMLEILSSFPSREAVSVEATQSPKNKSPLKRLLRLLAQVTPATNEAASLFGSGDKGHYETPSLRPEDQHQCDNRDERYAYESLHRLHHWISF
jgi:hypothetical protein